MSRIGKKPVVLPEGVTFSYTDKNLSVKGPKGELFVPAHKQVSLTQEGAEVTVSVKKPEDKKQRALWGLYRALLQNLVDGVTKGFSKQLEVIGVGFKVALNGQKITLNLGFSHPIEIDVPAGLAVTVDKNTITIAGADKQLVGQFAANIRELKKPEPYKGKGIRYSDEVVLRKAGKVVKAVGGGK